MPKDPSIKKVLVIGSGPIIIGQAAEFDYSGTQACRALKSEGIEVVLVNSNPATIMTDPDIADRVYVEPMTLTVLKRIIEKEKPDSILPNLGGQTGLNLAMELARSGYLEQAGVRLLGAKPDHRPRRGPPALQGHHGEAGRAGYPLQGGGEPVRRACVRGRDRLPGHRAPGVHHGRHGRRHL